MRLWLYSLLIALCSPLVSANILPAVQFYQATAYICGGIGSDQAALFRAARAHYPLSFTFGQHQGNKVAFIADVQVVMRNDYDQTVLNINSDGPFCLLDIDPGSYQVYVTYEGNTMHQAITVKRQGHQLSFTWPETLTTTQSLNSNDTNS